MTFTGFATAEGTQRLADRFEAENKAAAGHYRSLLNGLTLSSLGMGTYLGDPTPEDDALVTDAAIDSITSGAINVLDTAINYRFQNAERSLGRAFEALFANGFSRDELFVASKNGFLTPDAEIEENFRTYFTREFIETGIVHQDDIVGGMHCMTPKYLANQLDRSLQNLQLETLDLMYLHNAAESQLPVVGREEFMRRLKEAFEFYELARREGKIRFYGMATWNCFRVKADHPEYLNLEDVFKLAHKVGGEAHGFRFIQLPFNVGFHEAVTLETQTIEGRKVSALEAVMSLGMGAFASVPLLQGQLLNHPLPRFENISTPAQACLQFVRSHPGMIAPLVGHKNPAHVRDNVQIAKTAPLSLEALQAVLAVNR